MPDINVDEHETPRFNYDHRWYFPYGKDESRESEKTSGASKPNSDDEYDSDVDDNESMREDHSFDAIQHLFPCRQTDYLIRRKEDGQEEKIYADYFERKRYVIICSFYIPVLKHDLVASTCCNLQGILSELADDGDDKKLDFEVVLVTRMRSDFPSYDNTQVAEDAFNHFFSAFSPLFLAVPILESDRNLNLIRVMGSAYYSYPGCVFADLHKGQVSHVDMHYLCLFGPDYYPFTSARLLEVFKQADTILSGGMPLANLLDCQSSDVLDCVVRHSEGSSSCGKKQSLSNLTNKVVWLYYLCDGNFMDELCHLYKLCKAKKFGFELVVVRANSYSVDKPAMSSCWEDHVQSLLQKTDCCGWLHLPFKRRVSCRLKALCYSGGYDKLIVVGPNASYVEPDGKEVFLDYGIDAYPFTKQTVWDNQVAKLRGLSLQDWLGGCGVQSLKLAGKSICVSDLQGMDVLVYFGSLSSTDKLAIDWEGQVFDWINVMKSAAKGRFEMLFVCNDGFSYLEQYCSEMKWLLPVPYGEDCSKALIKSLYGRLGVPDDSLAAFGSNGRLLLLELEKNLLGHSAELAKFPESDDALPRDVGLLLNSQVDDEVWYRALKIN